MPNSLSSSTGKTLWKMFHSLSPPWETLSKNNDDHITWQQKQLQSFHVTQQVRQAKALTVHLFLLPIIFFFCCKHTTHFCPSQGQCGRKIFFKRYLSENRFGCCECFCCVVLFCFSFRFQLLLNDCFLLFPHKQKGQNSRDTLKTNIVTLEKFNLKSTEKFPKPKQATCHFSLYWKTD